MQPICLSKWYLNRFGVAKVGSKVLWTGLFPVFSVWSGWGDCKKCLLSVFHHCFFLFLLETGIAGEVKGEEVKGKLVELLNLLTAWVWIWAVCEWRVGSFVNAHPFANHYICLGEWSLCVCIPPTPGVLCSFQWLNLKRVAILRLNEPHWVQLMLVTQVKPCRICL